MFGWRDSNTDIELSAHAFCLCYFIIAYDVQQLRFSYTYACILCGEFCCVSKGSDVVVFLSADDVAPVDSASGAGLTRKSSTIV